MTILYCLFHKQYTFKEVQKMIDNKGQESSKNSSSLENFTVRVTNPMLYDRIHTLSAEYSVSVEMLVNAAIKRFIEDVDFVRSLRTGTIDLE